MPAPKIVDETEVRRWYEEGVTYKEMVRRYDEKYNIAMTPTGFSNLAKRRGWTQRNTTGGHDEQIPWDIDRRHNWRPPNKALRSAIRQANGEVLSAANLSILEGFRRAMAETDTVIHYDPDTEQGFWLVPRREGIDTGMIREPDKK